MTNELRWRRMEKLWAKASKLDQGPRESLILREVKDENDRLVLLEWSAIEGPHSSANAPSDAIGKAPDLPE